MEVVYAKETPSILKAKEKLLLAGIRTFGTKHVEALETIVQKESSFNYLSVNKTSGACGYFQFYPCSKMKCELTDVDCQIEEGMKYIKKRYGNPTNALEFHINHGWY